MVAETEARPVRKKGERGPTVSILAQIKARNLYLNQGLSVPAIAKDLGLGEAVVRKWVEQGRWSVMRRESYSRLIAKQDAQREAQGDAVIAAIASEAEESALAAMKNVKDSLTRSDEFAAKDFQAYTAGVKNLASTARMLREPLAGSVDQAPQLNMNFFFAGAPAQAEKAEPKTVLPVEVKQVTE